jgi:hypothetical protein
LEQNTDVSAAARGSRRYDVWGAIAIEIGHRIEVHV